MSSYLSSIRRQFKYYKVLGDRTFTQLSEADIFWQPDPEANSIAIIVGHLHGNMLSRWTDFLTADGEKTTRDRDGEFECHTSNKREVLEQWETGWNRLFTALDTLTEADLERTIYIRKMGHTVTEAINRQLSHYCYHVGQITFIGRIRRGEEWQSLSIPKGGSKAYNAEKFSKARHREHFTEEWMEDD